MMATNSDKNNKHIDAAMKAKKQIFKKRKDCILKKSMELSVLCGINVCAVIVDPNGKVETWPENKDDVMEIVKLYNQNSSDDGSKVGCKKKKKKFDLDLDHHHDHQVVLNLQQHELDEADSWIEGLSETSVSGFLTEINAKMNAVGSKLDILERTSTTMVDDGGDDGQMNDHRIMVGAPVVSCDGETAMGDLSINDPIPINFLNTKMVDDKMNDNIMPAAVVVCDGEEAMDHGIFKDQDQNQINHTYHYVDDQQNFREWFDKLVTWNSFEEDTLMLAMGDHSINDPIPINFLETRMIDDQMKDSIMPAAVVVSDGEEAMEHSIFKNPDQNQINRTYYCVDDQQNFDEWFDKPVTCNSFKEDTSMLDSDFWRKF